MKGFILSSLFILFATGCSTQKREIDAVANLKWHQVEVVVRATPWIGVSDPFPRATGVNLRTGEVKRRVPAVLPPQKLSPLSADDFLPPSFPELLPPMINEGSY